MRMTPMGEDQNDMKAVRDMVQDVSHGQFGANVPFFFTRYGMPVDLIGQWQGRACFLVSNGPSVKDLNLALLRQPGIITMTINNGASTLLMNGVTPTFWTCVDHPNRFVKQIWLNPAIMKFIPMAAFDKELWDNEAWKTLEESCGIGHPRDCPNILGYRRNEKFAAHRFFTESSINWGCHKRWGGCRTVLLPAIRIPYLLGFRRLYLLGVDLQMTDSAKYHFDEGRTPGAIRGNSSTYDRIIKEYGPGIQKYAGQLGYEIYNCNPASALTCFPQVPFAEAVAREAALSGPTEQISTRGMYVDPEKKKILSREDAAKEAGAI